MNALYYLLEANAYLMVFYAFYKLILQNETFYSINRFYILTTVLLSFLLPFLDLSAIRGNVYIQVYTEMPVPQSSGSSIWEMVLIAYLVGVCFLFWRLFKKIYNIAILVKSAEVINHRGFKEVRLPHKNLSFSFLNYLFINPELEEQKTILRHEQVHINQKHSLDILLIEVIQIINWFNPLIAFIRTDIKALHEYIADEIVSKEEIGAENYAMLLINNSYGAPNRDLSTQMFDQSLLKKRIMKLSQKKSSGLAMLKYSLLAFLIPSMLCISASSFSKSYGMMDLMPAKYIYLDTLKKKATVSPKVENKKIPAVVTRKKGVRLPPPPPPVEPSKMKSGKSTDISGTQTLSTVTPNKTLKEKVPDAKKYQKVEYVTLNKAIGEARYTKAQSTVKSPPLREVKINGPVKTKSVKEVLDRVNNIQPRKDKVDELIEELRIKEQVIAPPPPPAEPVQEKKDEVLINKNISTTNPEIEKVIINRKSYDPEQARAKYSKELAEISKIRQNLDSKIKEVRINGRTAYTFKKEAAESAGVVKLSPAKSIAGEIQREIQSARKKAIALTIRVNEFK